jgi:acyl dehydratase
MLNLAYVSEMMTSAFGDNWLSGGKLRAKFKEAARPGDTVTVTGRIDCIEQKSAVSYANCSFECHNQKGETIMTGEAMVRLSDGSK